MNSNKSFISRFYASHPIISHLLMIFLAGLLLIWAAMIFLNVWTHHGSTSVVPEIKNLSYASAAEVLQNNNLGIEISDSVYDRSTPPGTVLESWPKAGAVVKRGRQVYVTITAFSPKMVRITMPVTGVSSRQAVSYLRGLGITGIRIVHVPSMYPDLVESAKVDGHMLHADSEVPVTATVTLEVGSAPAQQHSYDTLPDDETTQSVSDTNETDTSIFD
ncbi:MAG: PASTA domain-containing protein [Muribaculaceae bacterium]|nr:PASTA domain-containing protein [Muribaculaceae bacterium]